MRVRLTYGKTKDGRYHTVTSPDVKGLFVTGETRGQAAREAMILVQEIRTIQGRGEAVVTSLEFSDRAA